MIEKVVFDTNIYIGIFNRGLYQDEINRFNKVVFLVHPVLHELWLGATVVTKDLDDYRLIREVVDIRFRDVV